MSDETFLYDDFFVPKDHPGIPIEVTVRGRVLTFYIKPDICTADKEYARTQAMTTKINSEGVLEVTNFDAGVLSFELLLRCLKAWPFKEADGTPVSINRDNLNALCDDVSEAVATALQKYIEVKRASYAPLEKVSVEASSQTDLPNPPSPQAA